MPRGGKRPGAGRKPEGITKKVSLTLTAEEWKQIEESGEPTIAAFIKKLLKEKRNQNQNIAEKQVTQIKGTETEGDQEKDEARESDQISKAPRADGELSWNQVCDIYERETELGICYIYL